MTGLIAFQTSQAAENGKAQVNIDFDEKIEKIVSDTCFQTLLKIRGIIDNDSLSDFDYIEEIVREFEKIGFDGGSRHDF